MASVDDAVDAYDAALDLDAGFLAAFSALEALLQRRKRYKLLEEAYSRQLERLAATDQTRLARAALWRALGDLRAKELHDDGAALSAYQASAELSPDDAPAQEALAAFATRVKGHEEIAREAWRRALPSSNDPGRVCLALGELSAKQKDLDAAWLATQVFDGLVDAPGAKEKLGRLLPPLASRKARAHLTDRLWQKTLFDPGVRGPVGEIMGILVEQAGEALAEPHSKFEVNPRKHKVDLKVEQPALRNLAELRSISRLFAMESAEIYSPFLGGPTEAKLFRGSRPTPDRELNIELCATHPLSLKLGGKFFSSRQPPQERACLAAYWMSFLRPELAMARLVPRMRAGVLFQAAISLVSDRYRCNADPKELARERKLLKKALNERALVALTTVVRQYVPDAGPDDPFGWLEGVELTAARAALLVAGEVGVFKRVILDPKLLSELDEKVARRRLAGFVMGGDLQALRAALGLGVSAAKREG
jgi:hypothetical protein